MVSAVMRRRRGGAFGMVRDALRVVGRAWACAHERAGVRARGGFRLCAGGGGSALADDVRRRSRLCQNAGRASSDGNGGKETEERGVHGRLSFDGGQWRSGIEQRRRPSKAFLRGSHARNSPTRFSASFLPTPINLERTLASTDTSSRRTSCRPHRCPLSTGIFVGHFPQRPTRWLSAERVRLRRVPLPTSLPWTGSNGTAARCVSRLWARWRC
jgi:hypothetical protein